MFKNMQCSSKIIVIHIYINWQCLINIQDIYINIDDNDRWLASCIVAKLYFVVLCDTSVAVKLYVAVLCVHILWLNRTLLCFVAKPCRSVVLRMYCG